MQRMRNHLQVLTVKQSLIVVQRSRCKLGLSMYS
jgi:hypothetical protein